jgi:cytochrome P450
MSRKAPGEAPFLNGIIHESLRLWPPAPNGMQRRTPQGGCIIDEKMVPAATQVSVHTMTIMRDERFFSKPDKFIPERWIDEERPKDFNHDTRAFVPFTVGQYACLGKNLAFQEIRLFVSRVLREFDITYPKDYSSGPFYRDIVFKGTLKVGSLPIVITKRDEMTLK